MSRTAVLTTAFAPGRLLGGLGGLQLVGSAKARELYYLSERVNAEALRLGLTNWICEPDELAAPHPSRNFSRLAGVRASRIAT